ncbi:regulatory protein, luxR family [Lentzea fradiae]|uniref:Regulatory protein, luxR family n=1 Tax=Lentzea fradiae TaxID=200378 RepID=A0A1G7UT10_9PSEU|nr:LuxR family transcriptional regulator [Lentzea fradiae]SDG50663.1 regulatory protein, luxR family [Lentzea fradiae]
MSFTPDIRTVERDVETGVIRQRLARCRVDGGRILLISGASGTGKTSLLEVAAEEAHAAGFRVLRTAGGAPGRDVEFGALRRLFRASPPDGEERRARADVIRFSRRHAVEAGARAEPRRADIPFEVLHNLYLTVVGLAAVKPVAVLVDDLHRVDLSSIRWLLHLARRAAGVPVVVVAAAADDVDTAAEPLIAELRAAPRCEVLELAPLSPRAVEAVVAARLGAAPAPSVVAACYEVSAGNPRVLGELLHGLSACQETDQEADQVADQVAAVHEVGVRVHRARLFAAVRAQSAPVVAFAGVLALLGEDADLAIAAEVTAAGSLAAGQAVAALGRAGVLHPGTVRFAHPEIGRTIIEDMAPAQRERTHSRIARVLSDRGAPVDVVAAHLVCGGPPTTQEMVAVLREAAVAAVDRGEPELAVAYLRHALTGQWKPDLLVTLLTALTRVERSADPRAAWEHLAEALRLMDSPLRRARAAVDLFPLATGCTAAPLVDLLEDCLEWLSQAGEPTGELRTRLLAHMVSSATGNRDVMARLRPRLDALDPDSLGGTPGQCALLAVHVMLAALEGRLPAASAVESATRALQGDLLLRDDMLHPMFVSAIVVLQLAERLDLVTPLYDAGIGDAKVRNLPAMRAMLTSARSVVRFHSGDVPGALVEARASLQAYADGHQDDNQPLTVAAAVACLGELGQWDEAAELVRSDFAPAVEHSFHWCWMLAARAVVLEGRGDLRAALEQTLDCGRRLTWWNIHNEAVLPWRGRAALLHWRLGEVAEARRLAGEALELSRRWGADGAVGSALRVAGLVEGGAKGFALLRRAVVYGERSPARLELAKTLIELGTAQHTAGDDEAARATLRRGLDLATQCGATTLVLRARSELVAAGGRPRRDRLHGTNALTPAEWQVVRLAALGSSNDQIAQSLFVTQRTVEFHLTNSYRKLGLTERSQLVDVVDPDGHRGSAAW